MSISKNAFAFPIQQIFNLLTLNGKYRLIGSANIKAIRYSSDYDLQEKDNFASVKNLKELFKKKFEFVESNPNILITDFKCGVDSNQEPLRWNLSDIKRGYKTLYSGSKISFEEALIQKSTIKLDIIALINGQYTEFSENYYLKIGKFSNFDSKKRNKKDIIKDLQESVKEYIDEDNYFKALKRIFSIFQLSNTSGKTGSSTARPKRAEQELENFFNSDIGLLNKLRSDLEVLELVSEQGGANLEALKNNLQIIKQTLGSIPDFKSDSLIKALDSISLPKSKFKKDILIKVKEQIFNFVNSKSKIYFLKKLN